MRLFTIFISLTLLMACSRTGRKSPREYSPDWESVTRHPVPEWFRDAKFGIYFHWGVYSVPAYENEWYSHWMYVKDHPVNRYHIETYGPLDEFGYKDFIPMFTAEKFDPDGWAALFKEAGARFAGPVAEHADGFAMWDSELTRWDAAEMGPKRDVVGEMERAIRAQGLKFITSLHHSWLYGWYPTWDEHTDAGDPAYSELYGPRVPSTAWAYEGVHTEPLPDDAFCRRWHSRVMEVMDKYRPDLIYFDGKLDIIDEQYRLDFLSHYYNRAAEWGRDVAVTYKFEDLREGAGILDVERARMSGLTEYPWLTDDSMDWGSWCHVSEPDYKSTDRIIDFLVDVVSKNGCMLLNIPPMASGEIPEPVRQRLTEIGQWLEINGEAIYETRPWKVFGEGPTQVVEGHLRERENKDNVAEDIRFTRKGNCLYATCLGIPEATSITVHSLNPGNDFQASTIKKISLLGTQQEVHWDTGAEGLELAWEEVPALRYAMVFRIELEN
jgi:alpha-L-fucosidase